MDILVESRAIVFEIYIMFRIFVLLGWKEVLNRVMRSRYDQLIASKALMLAIELVEAEM